MLPKIKITQRILTCSLLITLASGTIQAQQMTPTLWLGVSGGRNFNFYNGTTQQLNSSVTAPVPFKKGSGGGNYGTLQLEYRPESIFGLMLNVGYDGRSAKFDDVMAATNAPASLKTDLSYLTLEPSLRIGSRTSHIFFFAGPRIGMNMHKDFTYNQHERPTTTAELSEMRKTVFSGQVGLGVEYEVTGRKSNLKVKVAPFISYHPTFGQAPREIENLSLSTLRTGIAIKFGKPPKAPTPVPVVKKAPAGKAVWDIPFLVRGPKTVLLKRQVSEALPLRNALFFEEGSAAIPSRYVLLTKQQAKAFREEQLLKEQSKAETGRSARQLMVYYNILNILGDRMRANPASAITLTGSAAQGTQQGKALAESVKQYLVTVYGIQASRITTQGRTKPRLPSEQPNATKELTLLRAEDRRVDIESTSAALLMEAGSGVLKPVQINATQVDPLDGHVIFKVGGEGNPDKPWTLDITDEKGARQHYGPFKRNQESIPGKTILGNRKEGTFKVTMHTESKDGTPVTKEEPLHLVSQNEVIEKGFRFSILFNFDKAETLAPYSKFLTQTVTPLITDGSTVIIHGHTDASGEEEHNHTLSKNRALQVQKTLKSALDAAGRKAVKFEVLAFGEDAGPSPFENNLPEERFYNRTVIIDIIPGK
jgi:outer membrane protein OmpA-like peptidoglycan-associated protein